MQTVDISQKMSIIKGKNKNRLSMAFGISTYCTGGMKMKKLWYALSVSLLLAALVLGGVLSAAASNSNAAVTWAVDGGVLTISGEGAMVDYNDTDAPWAGCKDDVTSIVIGKNITAIGASAFSGFGKVETVTFEDGSNLDIIGAGAFNDCASLSQIVIPNGVSKIGDYAFYGCGSLGKIDYCGTQAEWADVVKPATWSIRMVYHHERCVSVDASTHRYACDLCDYASEASAHAWDNGEVVKAATHTEFGEKLYTCSDCGATKTEEIAKTTEHTVYGNCEPFNDRFHQKVCECGNDTIVEPHRWNETSRTPATHLSEGEVKYSCSGCGMEKTETLEKDPEHKVYSAWTKVDENSHKKVCECGNDTIVEAHHWNAGMVTIQATHTKEGLITYVCEDCGATKTETLEKDPEHKVYSAWTKVDENSHKKVCECGEDTIVQAHNWDEGTVIIKATHLTEGTISHICQDCRATKIDTIPKTEEHSVANRVSIGDQDKHKLVCECGEEIGTEAHKWQETITKPATHTEFGLKTSVCVCGESRVDVIPKTTTHTYGKWSVCDDTKHQRECECGSVEYADHKWDKGTTLEEATHTAEGSALYTCLDCPKTETRVISKTTEHEFNGEWAKHDAAQHKEICACGEVKYEDHTWDDGVVDKEHTHVSTGRMEYTCTSCGETKIESIPAGHVYGDWVNHDAEQHKKVCACGEGTIYAEHKFDTLAEKVEPTHITEGREVYSCVCGATQTVLIKKTTEHTFGDKWVSHDGTQHKKTCACGEVIYEDHSYSEWTADGDTMHKKSCSCGSVIRDAHEWTEKTVEATHTKEGQIIHTCSDCGTQKVVLIDKLPNHTYGDWTAYDEDQHKKSCECGRGVYDYHTWDQGKVVVEASNQADGKIVYTCADCGAEKTDVIPKLGGGASSGCGATVVGGAALMLVLTIGSVGLACKKKKD